MSVAGLKEGTLSLGGALRGMGIDPVTLGISAAITAISLINAGIKKYKENLREAAQESAKQAEESARAVESLTQLKTELEDGSKSTDALTTAFKEELKQMGYTETGIDNLIKKYGGLKEAIKGTTEEVLAKNQADARAAKDDAKKSALTELGELVEGFTYEGGFIRLAFSVDNWIPEDIGQYSKEIQDEFQKFYDLGENADSTQNIDDLLAYYNQAQKVLDLLKNAAIDDEDIYNESAYLQAKSAVDKLSASMDGYANAITRVHEADAQIELSNFLKTNDIATKEDFDAYIKGVEDGTIGMVDGKEASDAYKQVLIDVANDAFPQFSNAAKEAGGNVDKMTVSLSDSADKIKELNSIFKELNDGGLSPDSIEKIISDYPELIGYIGDETRLRTELKKKIAEEETKYKQALRNKVMASSSFAELVESKNETLFKELGLAYNKDTQKFELENQKKLAIAQKYGDAAKQSWEWSKNTWGQIWADEQVLSAPDFTTELHAAGKNSKYKTQSGDWKFEVFNNGEQKTYTYEAGSSMAKILDSQRELANLTNFDIDFGDDSSSSKDSYEDLYDEFLETLEQEVEDIDDSISRINTKLEHAIKTGNAEQIQILSKELDDAYKQKKELLESKANEARTQLALIMEEIYAIAPQLRGKSINEITPYEIEAMSMSLGDASDKWDSITKSAQNYYETISEWSDEWWANEEDKLNSTEEYYNTILDQIDRHAERIEENYDDQIKAEEALLTIKQAQFETQNNIADAQAEIDKEIKNSRNSKQYLSKSEYDKIFNEEDYEELSDIISDINNDISNLTDDFYKQVEDAYANGQVYLVEHITAEYERQLAMKERELEIAKANVDLEKKRLNLENTLAEKNIKQYSENGITWVADQEKVRQATEDFADAQAEVAKIQKEATQQRELDSRQANIDMLEMQKNALNDSITKLKEAVENVTDPLADFGTLIQTLINDTNKSISETAESVNFNFGGSRGSSGGGGGGGFVQIGLPSNYEGATVDVKGVGKVTANIQNGKTQNPGLKPGDVVNTSDGRHWEITGGTAGNYTSKEVDKSLYDNGGIASGKGLMLKDVDEEETVLPPWLTAKVLTPEYNENFSKLLENMQMVSYFNPSDFIVKPQTDSLIMKNNNQPTSISKTWSGNMYVDGGDPNEVLKAIDQAFDRITI